MSSIFWYCLLAAIGLGIAAFTVYKKGTFPKLAAFYLFAASITFTGEYFVLVVFQGYIYKPGIFSDLFMDNLLGHVIINLTLWPSTAIAFWAFSLRYRWIPLIAAGYMLVELLFVKLGIYEQHWWRYYVTGILVVAFCIFTRLWFDMLNRKAHGFVWYITLFFAAEVIIQVPVALLLLSDKMYYRPGWVNNAARDSTLFAVILSSVISLVFVICICKLQKWLWKLMPIVFCLLADYILIELDILNLQNGWNIFYLAIIHLASLIVFILLSSNALTKARLRFVN